jgi:pimeloyl-ACP methyl ester carboxylesterase
MARAHAHVARVDLGRYQLAYRSGGTGRPTIVLEAGGGCTQDSWAAVFDQLAHLTGVVSYDRAGLGASDPGPRRRSCQDMVHDLHDLLVAAHIPAPYVLVGHSFGGRLCACMRTSTQAMWSGWS